MEANGVNQGSKHIKYLIIGLSLFAIAATAIVLYHYFQKFPGNAETTHATWGQIGDFFGGVLNPIYGFVGFIALLSTIILQSQELEATRTEMRESTSALNKQATHMENESKKTEYYTMIDAVYSEIMEMMDKHISISTREDDSSYFAKLRDVFTETTEHHEFYFDELRHKTDEENPETKKTISSFALLFSELGRYLGEYKRISKNNVSLMYFSLRTQYPARKLFEKGYLDQVYLDAIEIGETLSP